MSHRWLIAVSMSAHLCVAGALFATGVWHLERLEADKVHVELRIPLEIPAPASRVAAQVPVADFVPKVVKGPTQPTDKPPPKITQRPPSDDQPPGLDDGGGGGSGDPDAAGHCTENCDPPPPPPVCGNGVLEGGEQCDDGNTANGDRCSSTCRIELPPPPPRIATVAPQVLQGLRTAGTTQVRPSDTTQQRMVHDGDTRVVGTLKLCVGTDGGVTSASVLRSTRYADYDRGLLSAVYGWRYRPYTVNGVAVPACSTVTFIYQIR